MSGPASSLGARDHAQKFLRRGLVKNFLALGSAEAITKTLALVAFAVVSRTVGPASMGLLALAQTITAFAGMVADGGISTLSQRQIAADPGRARVVASVATAAQLCLASLTAVTVGLASLVLPIGNDVSRLLVAMLPVVVAQAISLVYVLQAFERMRDVAYVRVIGQTSTAVLSLGMVLVTGDVIWAAVAVPVGVFLGDAICLYFLFRRYEFAYQPVARRDIEGVIRSASPFLGIALLTQLLNSLDIIALSVLGSPTEVGIYSVAYRLVLVAFTLSALLTQAAFPQLVKRFRSNTSAFKDLVRLLVRLAAHFTFPAAAMLAVEAPSIIRALFGDEFAASSDVLRILAFWIPLGFFNSLVAIALTAAGRQQTYLWIVGIGVGATAAGMIVWVPVAGSVGAAQVVLGREALMMILFSAVAVRDLKVSAAVAFVRQVPWFVVPFATLGALNLVLPYFSLFLSLTVLGLSILAVEWASGWPLARELLGISEDAEGE
jgi:O-antigen/teichoic acid export membrane protein